MTARQDRRVPKNSEEKQDHRSEFQRDRDRVLYSEAFRRLQGVTQVVSADEGTVIHNRLTHSLKVAQVARRIAERINSDKNITEEFLGKLGGLDPDVCEAAGLAHDLGHPPFGHVAEAKLQDLMKSTGHFEGNAQSFRIITKIEPHSDEYRGLNLSRATLAAVTKYPRARTEKGGTTHKKYGHYSLSETDEFTFARELFNPADKHKSLEAEIMDFADDITFAIHDTEDFFRAGLIPLQQLGSENGGMTQKTLELVNDIKSRWDRKEKQFDSDHLESLKIVLDLLRPSSSYSGLQEERIQIKRATSGLISDWVKRGINVNPRWAEGKPRVVINKEIAHQIMVLKELVWSYVIDRPSLALQQEGYKRIIENLYKFFVAKLEDNELRSIPLQFHGLCQSRDKDKETNERLAADIICSLTDSQALSLYRRTTGSDPGGILRGLI
jgi:dGTPase